MGVLDRQSLSERVANRKLGRQGLRAAERSWTDSGERRRPERGLRQEPSAARAGRRNFGERLLAAGRILLLLLLVPVQLLFLLARPLELLRRVREAPSRMQARTRRMRIAARDRETATGRLALGLRLTAHFVAEEWADMRDGFPRPAQALASGLGMLEEALFGLGLTLGLVDRRGDREELRERFGRAAALGLIAGCAVVGLFVSSFQAIEALRQSDRLTIATIQVQGLHRLGVAEILAAGDFQLGDSLVDLPLPDVRSAIEALPWVATVELRRDLVSRALEVQVVERVPALVLASGGLRLVDQAGVAFKGVERGDPSDLPVLSLVGQESTPEAVAEATAAALEVLNALASGRAITSSDLSELRYDREDGTTLITREGLPVHLGHLQIAQRLGRLERAVASGGMPLEALASVDLGLRDRIVAVPRRQPKARQRLAQTLEAQPVGDEHRDLMLHLRRVAATPSTDLFPGGSRD